MLTTLPPPALRISGSVARQTRKMAVRLIASVAVPFLVGDVLDALARQVDAGAIDDAVNAAVVAKHARDRGANVDLAGHVRLAKD